MRKHRFGTTVPFLALNSAVLQWHDVASLTRTGLARMFGVTAEYQVFFSHRSYKLNRFFRLALAELARSPGQNNCHRFTYTCRRRILRWEVDFTYYAPRLLNQFGISRKLRGVRLPGSEPEVPA